MGAVKKTPVELAGKYEMIKDASGNEKRGLCLTIYAMGPCLVCTLAPTLATRPFSTGCLFLIPNGAMRIPLTVCHLRRQRQGIHG